MCVQNAHHSTKLLAQTTLRNVLGTKTLSEILTERDVISASMQQILDEATEQWGIKVERVEMFAYALRPATATPTSNHILLPAPRSPRSLVSCTLQLSVALTAIFCCHLSVAPLTIACLANTRYL